MRLTRYLLKEGEESAITTERQIIKGIKGGKFTVDGYETVTDDFHCDDFRLTSLEGCAGTVEGDFSATHNKLTTLAGIDGFIKEIKGNLDVTRNPIKSAVLGVLKIKGLQSIKMDDKKVGEILNKYLPNSQGNKGVMLCQSELLDEGLDDFAEL